MKSQRDTTISRLPVFRVDGLIDIGTGHIAESDDKLLTEIEEGERESCLVVYAYPYGHIVVLSLSGVRNGGPEGENAKPEEYREVLTSEGFSPEFANIVVLYLQSGQYGIKFDRDGTEYEELPTFEW